MSEKFKESFPKGYRDVIIGLNLRESSKKFNKHIKEFNYVIVYPYSIEGKAIYPCMDDDNSDTISLIVGFSNEPTVYKCDREGAKSAYSHLRHLDSLTVKSSELTLTESVAFETSLFEPIPLEKVEWSKLINAPKLDDGDFSDLQTTFLSFFGLEENEYNDEHSDSFNFSRFFCHEENKPDGLELRVVWRDVDSGEKYGDIVTLIFWKNDFIGWVTHSGRWLDTEQVSTVDIEKFKELMQIIYDKTGFIRSKRLHGISIYDMDKDEVDDVVSVPGVSMRNYSEEV